MNILAPLNDPAAVDDYLACGASEFYVGFTDGEWTRRFGAASDLNRLSGFGSQANACDFPSLLDAIRRIADTGAHVYVPFNGAAYSTAQCDYIAHAYFPDLARAGADGVILSGPELIGAAHGAGLAAVASTMAAVANADIMRFYRQRGIDRVIFPRELSIGEIRAIVRKAPEVECEVFLMRNGCVFSDSHCLGCHRAERYSLCRDLRYGRQWEERRGQAPVPACPDAPPEGSMAELFAQAACGLCALWEFLDMGICAAKVVGRCDGTEGLLRDIALVRDNLAIAARSATAREYRAAMRLPENAAEICASGLNCYYPEVGRL